MIKLAITGSIASGKTLAESILREKAILSVDTDKIAHQILCEDKDAVKETLNLLGESILDENRIIDRKKIAKIVFSDAEKLKQLEKILHPRIKSRIEEIFLSNNGEEIITVSVPQLYEAGWETMFDFVLLVTADDNIRLKRLLSRNKFSHTEALKRINAQIKQEIKIYIAKKRGDFIVENSSSTEEFRQALDEIVEKIKKQNKKML